MTTYACRFWLVVALALGAMAARAQDSKRGPKSVAQSAATLKTPAGDLEIFPADNPWNQDISSLPVHQNSRRYLTSIGLDKGLHPCFGADWQGAPNGIPYVLVSSDTPRVKVELQYPDESDPGPYPVPDNPPIEGGPKAPEDSDRHILMI